MTITFRDAIHAYAANPSTTRDERRRLAALITATLEDGPVLCGDTVWTLEHGRPMGHMVRSAEDITYAHLRDGDEVQVGEREVLA